LAIDSTPFFVDGEIDFSRTLSDSFCIRGLSDCFRERIREKERREQLDCRDINPIAPRDGEKKRITRAEERRRREETVHSRRDGRVGDTDSYQSVPEKPLRHLHLRFGPLMNSERSCSSETPHYQQQRGDNNRLIDQRLVMIQLVGSVLVFVRSLVAHFFGFLLFSVSFCNYTSPNPRASFIEWKMALSLSLMASSREVMQSQSNGNRYNKCRFVPVNLPLTRAVSSILTEKITREE